MNTIEATVSEWPGIEVAPHRFNAEEFTLGGREIGHLHDGHLLDIPFAKRIRDILIEEQRAQKHHIYPDSGWVSYRIRSDEDVDEALWLLRISYLYQLIALRKREGDHSELNAVEQELATAEVSDELRAIFEDILPETQSKT